MMPSIARFLPRSRVWVPLFAAATILVGSRAEAEEPDWDGARAFWSFQAPASQALPAVERHPWARTPLDRFILAGIEARDWAPAPPAHPATLLRRTSFHLAGLPPSEGDTKTLTAPVHPNADERQVDRLLASYRFGERMASFWLTIARYAEDQAHQVGSDSKYFYPNAHHYRQWVIDAFNRDLPYDKFIEYQLAADFDPETKEAEQEALGFLGLGPKYYNRGRLEVKADEWEDRVDTVTRSFLALTVACARCHDHKYDPISAEDYHALAGVFASTEMHNLPIKALANENPASKDEAPEEAGKDKEQKKEKEKEPSPEECLHVVKEGEVQNLPVFIRGNVDRKGETVPRRFLTILAGPEPKPFEDGSGRRELAKAIADPDNPLTWRVMANRLWSVVFGQPLVGTPSNFGKLGMRPTHPALLDYLAVRFS